MGVIHKKLTLSYRVVLYLICLVLASWTNIIQEHMLNNEHLPIKGVFRTVNGGDTWKINFVLQGRAIPHFLYWKAEQILYLGSGQLNEVYFFTLGRRSRSPGRLRSPDEKSTLSYWVVLYPIFSYWQSEQILCRKIWSKMNILPLRGIFRTVNVGQLHKRISFVLQGRAIPHF